VNDHGRQIVAGDVLAEIFYPSVDTGYRCDGRSADCHGPVGLDDAFANQLSVGTANTVEVLQELQHDIEDM
jgi:hypothetical protein